ncbi:MAG: hypothetical protein M3321_12605 [Actinomycetota bacterium]|nr:hypothetical protein [Actinomycetota bacterium]
MTVHRIRFDVERVFRGARVDTIDVTTLDAEELDAFELGRRYVVFAEPRTFGVETTPRLAPVGYWQGAFAVAGDGNRADVATNRRGDRVEVDNPLSGPRTR